MPGLGMTVSLNAIRGTGGAGGGGLDFSALTNAYLRPNGTDGYVRPGQPNSYYQQPGA